MSDLPVSDSPKPALRKQALTLRATLSMAELSLAICDRIAGQALFSAAKRILFYHPFRNELDLRSLAERFPEKSWFLPAVEPDARMTFHPYHPSHDLNDGEYGIQEPLRFEDGEILTPHDLRADDLMILPGLLFDRAGYRLGYGKGYFDRFLGQARQEKKTCIKLGAVPSALLWQPLPRDPWDLPVDWLVTENGAFPATASNIP